MAKDPDLSNIPYLGKPDEPGVKYHGNPPRSRYPDDLNCHTTGEQLEAHSNPDPINAWAPGSVAEQRWEHFAVKGSPSLGEGRPERDGPDYNKVAEEEGDGSFWIRLSYPADAILPRTEWILLNIVPTALRSFIRHNLQYGNTDESLGLQGQFSEIYHITAKLKRQIWDRRNPESVANGEVQEQLEALIGHALLALDLLEKGNKDGRATS